MAVKALENLTVAWAGGIEFVEETDARLRRSFAIDKRIASGTHPLSAYQDWSVRPSPRPESTSRTDP